jgi:hypothetical protein
MRGLASSTLLLGSDFAVSEFAGSELGDAVSVVACWSADFWQPASDRNKQPVASTPNVSRRFTNHLRRGKFHLEIEDTPIHGEVNFVFPEAKQAIRFAS